MSRYATLHFSSALIIWAQLTWWSWQTTCVSTVLTLRRQHSSGKQDFRTSNSMNASQLSSTAWSHFKKFLTKLITCSLDSRMIKNYSPTASVCSRIRRGQTTRNGISLLVLKFCYSLTCWFTVGLPTIFFSGSVISVVLMKLFISWAVY